MTMHDADTYSEVIDALLRERLSGADREFCERIQENGFADRGNCGGEHAGAARMEANQQRARVRSLCLGHAVPLPN
jgi:hypothetical protein